MPGILSDEQLIGLLSGNGALPPMLPYGMRPEDLQALREGDLRGVQAQQAPPADPYSVRFNRSGLSMALPAPKGAAFDAYANIGLRPGAIRLNGLGLRYRQSY